MINIIILSHAAECGKMRAGIHSQQSIKTAVSGVESSCTCLLYRPAPPDGSAATGGCMIRFSGFFTGHLIARFGVERIVAAGLAILAASGAVGLAGVDLENFFIALILLGIGWNFGFIGATAMLASAHTPEERGRVQGMNDMLVFGCVTVASLASGGLMNCSGTSPQEGWSAVNLAMAPFLALAGGALIWLAFRPKTA